MAHGREQRQKYQRGPLRRALRFLRLRHPARRPLASVLGSPLVQKTAPPPGAPRAQGRASPCRKLVSYAPYSSRGGALSWSCGVVRVGASPTPLGVREGTERRDSAGSAEHT